MWFMDYVFIYSSSSLSGCAFAHHHRFNRWVHLDHRLATYLVCERPQKVQATFSFVVDNESLQYVHSRSSWIGLFEAIHGCSHLFFLMLQFCICIILYSKIPLFFILWWEVQKSKWVRNTKFSSEEPLCCSTLLYH